MRITTTELTTRRTLLLLAGLLTPVSTAVAADGVRVLDLQAQRSLVVMIAESPERTVEGPADAPVVVRMPRASILHRFRGELVDAEGRVIVRRPTWSISLIGKLHDALARLTSDNAVVELMRPYGALVEEGDSMVVVAEVPEGLQGAILRLTIEYELPDSRASRLPVRLMGAVMDGDAWTWRAVEDGRLVAISSPAIAGVALVVIEDVESGAELWRGRALPREAGFAAARGESIRLAVSVERGRTYRLRIIGPHFEPTDVVGPPVAVAFLLPDA